MSSQNDPRKSLVALPPGAPPVWALLAAYNVALEVCRERNPIASGYVVTPDGFHEWLLKRQDLVLAKAKDRHEKAEKLGKAKTKKTTVAEAKAAIAGLPSTMTFVWGTRQGDVGEGTKADFEAALSNMADGDALVWGT